MFQKLSFRLPSTVAAAAVLFASTVSPEGGELVVTTSSGLLVAFCLEEKRFQLPISVVRARDTILFPAIFDWTCEVISTSTQPAVVLPVTFSMSVPTEGFVPPSAHTS